MTHRFLRRGENRDDEEDCGGSGRDDRIVEDEAKSKPDGMDYGVKVAAARAALQRVLGFEIMRWRFGELVRSLVECLRR